jgi:hypothetical protein
MIAANKPTLSFWQVINMNVGFFGIQNGFGRQQSAVTPLYTFLHARPEDLSLLNLAGLMTGLLFFREKTEEKLPVALNFSPRAVNFPFPMGITNKVIGNYKEDSVQNELRPWEALLIRVEKAAF